MAKIKISIMKNIFFTIVIFLFSITVNCQNIEYLKKSDTLYIKFKGTKYEKKYDKQTRITPSNFNEKTFQFELKKNLITLNFVYAKFKNFEKKNAGIISEEKKINKKFLKNNKNKIITISSLKNYSYEEITCEILSQSKTFYVIDYTEKESIMIYEVNSMNYCPSIE